MTESAKKYNFFYHFLFLSAYFVCSPPPFRPSPFLILSLQFFFRSFSLPSCLSLFITCFYRCVSLPPVSSFLFLCHLFYCIRFLFCILFFYMCLSLYQYFSLYYALSFLIFPFIFLCFFRFSIYTTVYLLLLYFVASSCTGLFSLSSLVSFSPNKFIRNKLWIAKKYYHRSQYPSQGVSCW